MGIVGDEILRPEDPEQYVKYVGANIPVVTKEPWSRLVLIMAPPSSGSTWFAQSLAKSFGITYIHEPDSRRWASLWTPAILAFRYIPTNYNIPRDIADWHKAVMYNQIAFCIGENYVKTVLMKFTQVNRALYYHEMFQRPKSVFLVRGVEGMYNSYIKRGWDKTILNREYLEAMLADSKRQFEWTRDNPERFYIRTIYWYQRMVAMSWPIYQYEDLVSEPSNYKDVFQNLGLEPETPIPPKPERAYAWKEELTNQELASFKRLKIKYEPITGLGDRPIIDYMHVE